MKTFTEIKEIFEQANTRLINNDSGLFANQVSERTLCGALMIHIHDIIGDLETFQNYYVDVEYNRNKGGIKTICKTIRGEEDQIIKINCDLILHSRGENKQQDNLLAVEMKKSTRPRGEKDKDRARLVALTKASFNDTWAWDGQNLPEHVCGYVLGVYYEINYRQKEISVEYYRQGMLVDAYTLNFLV